MFFSPVKRWQPDDTAINRGYRGRSVAVVVVVIVLVALTVLAFIGYRQPDLLLDYINLRYCG